MDVPRPSDGLRPLSARGVAVTGEERRLMGAQRYVIHPTFGWMTLEKYNEVSPLIGPRRILVLADDHDRIVAEAEARGWNAAVEAAIKAVAGVYPVSDQWGHHTLPHIDRRQASAAIAAVRKPEVEG